MKFGLHTLLIVSVIFLFRIIQSCCTCNSETIPFSYDFLTIKNLDNAGDRVRYANGDSMYSGAIAFEMIVHASGWSACSAPLKKSFGYSDAGAIDCERRITAWTCNGTSTSQVRPEASSFQKAEMDFGFFIRW